MSSPDFTCWSLIRAATEGDPAARERFARVYRPVVAAYLGARWRASRRNTDDAVQDVFVECFRGGGLLDKADPERGEFRGFLLAAVRNVARRHEARQRPTAPIPVDLPADDTGPAEAFDKAWARALLREAARVQDETAKQSGPAAVRRVHLLRLRFHERMPIRDIATHWGEDAAKLHHEYATAREEFHAALRTVVAFHYPGRSPGDVNRACERLLQLLG
jgi:DNA-directed RNA polymerase specialized sigma24 family protein